MWKERQEKWEEGGGRVKVLGGRAIRKVAGEKKEPCKQGRSPP
jgi:hypothetical protein